jgi:nicotinamide mononucleotide (NMN) deamidase PncC
MAAGVRARFGSTYGISTTGVAGPTEQDGRAVGTVYVGFAGPAGQFSVALQLRGDRSRIRRSSVLVALDLLRRELSGLSRVSR